MVPRWYRMLSKWVTAVGLKQASGTVLTSFIRDNIFRKFSIPKHILSDNGTPFINSHVPQLCMSIGSTMLSQTLTIPKGMVRQRLPTKLCYEFLVGWPMGNLNNDGQTLFLLCYGSIIPHSVLQLMQYLSPLFMGPRQWSPWRLYFFSLSCPR